MTSDSFLAHISQFTAASASTNSPPKPIPVESKSSPKSKSRSSTSKLNVSSPNKGKLVKKEIQDDPTGKNSQLKVKKESQKDSMAKYSHLKPLPDHLNHNLNILLCGINPGIRSAETGTHYGHPGNRFWKCLAGSGLTDRLYAPCEGVYLPERFNLGLTNLVERPTVGEKELNLTEKRAAVPIFLQKILKYKPKSVCFVGMGICKVFLQHFQSPTTPRKVKDIKVLPGLQPLKFSYNSIEETKEVKKSIYIFCIPSTSGQVAAYSIEQSINWLKELKTQLDSGKELTVEGMVEIQVEDYIVDDEEEMVVTAEEVKEEVLEVVKKELE